MENTMKKSCIILTGKELKNEKQLLSRRFNIKTLHDEKEFLNEMKIERTDLLIIIGPLENLSDDEVFKIATARIVEEEREMIVAEIKPEGSAYEVKRFRYADKKFVLTFFMIPQIEIDTIAG